MCSKPISRALRLVMPAAPDFLENKIVFQGFITTAPAGEKSSSKTKVYFKYTIVSPKFLFYFRAARVYFTLDTLPPGLDLDDLPSLSDMYIKAKECVMRYVNSYLYTSAQREVFMRMLCSRELNFFFNKIEKESLKNILRKKFIFI